MVHALANAFHSRRFLPDCETVVCLSRWVVDGGGRGVRPNRRRGFVRKGVRKRLQWVDLLDVYCKSTKSAHNSTLLGTGPAASAAGTRPRAASRRLDLGSRNGGRKLTSVTSFRRHLGCVSSTRSVGEVRKVDLPGVLWWASMGGRDASSRFGS